MRIFWLALALSAICTIGTPTAAQSCPDPDTRKPSLAASSLHGTLIYHDELRQWLGLRVDKSICGEGEIELTFLEPKDWRQAEALRDCEVTVIGELFYSPTGYYSATMAVTDPVVAPGVTCKPHPVKTDPALSPRKPNIKAFVAEVLVDYRDKGRVAVRVWEGRQKKSDLTPWEAYIHYELTGSHDVMWFGCADGFEIKQISQNPKPKNAPFQDDSSLAGTVLLSETLNTVSFLCVRKAK